MSSNPSILDDFSRLTNVLSDGDLNREASELLNTTIAKLERHATTHGSAAGSISLKLTIGVNSKGQVQIGYGLDSKTPKAVTGTSSYWVTDEQKLSVKNPRQVDMFEDGGLRPRRVAKADE